MKRRIILSDEMKQWVRENYATTPNAEIMERLGCSRTTLYEIAKAMNLEKDPEYLYRSRLASVGLAHDRLLSTGYAETKWALKRRHAEWVASGKKTVWGYKKGYRVAEYLGPERDALRRQRISESRRKIIARDRRRIDLGLEPLTRVVKPVKCSRLEEYVRHHMRECGYITFRNDSVIYYDDKTKRSARREAHATDLGLMVMHLNKRVTT